jgi:hypothetical protein
LAACCFSRFSRSVGFDTYPSFQELAPSAGAKIKLTEIDSKVLAKPVTNQARQPMAGADRRDAP